jgi:hypothetical protein
MAFNILGFFMSPEEVNALNEDELTATESHRPQITALEKPLKTPRFYTGDIEELDDEQRKALFETFFGDMPNAA